MCAPAQATESAARVEYFYVEANEGGSSGGHVALRIGADVFHYQQRAGLLQLLRDDVRDFLLAYALAGNREVHALRLDVSSDTAARLLARFESRQRAGQRQLERLALLRADRELLEQASGIRHDADAPLQVPGAGYFVSALPAAAPLRPSPALIALRARVESRAGGASLEARIEALRRERERLVPYASPEVQLADVETEPPLAYTYSSRHTDLASAQTALELLRDAQPLRDDALLAADGEPLEPAERDALCAFRAPLAAELADLALGTRPDWGRAFVVGAARLLALEASCRRGELLVLDARSDSSDPDAEVQPAPRREALGLLARDASEALAEARGRLLGAAWDERRYSDLEARASQQAELLRVAAQGGPLRMPEARSVPERPAPRLDLPRASLQQAQLVEAAQQARRSEALYASALAALHAYHLVTRNCVTEIFHTLHAALGSREQIEAALGARIDPAARGQFIPFVSAHAVRSHYRIASERSVPSLRVARVAQIAEREGRLATWREHSPWTASGYQRAASDSLFVFFSDTAPVLRPLFGLANLAAGASQAVFGVLWAPRDGGRQLVAGLRGAFWSLPELAFFSVRKGVNEYVSPEWIAELDAELGS